MAYKFDVYKDKSGEFRFRFKAPNGETMFSSQGYKQKRSALNAIASIQKNAPGAEVNDETG
ncbi:MAG: YegP family protein [Desulfosarcinaceae bacterium]|nr:YegP family protein [Desulfosarcinaceae bacterium]